MKITELTTVDAFVAVDLHDADVTSVGIVRSAPKILQSGATELARSLTYTFAVLEQQRSGASAGVNAVPADRPGAIAAFVDEIRPMVDAGSFLPDPGKGVEPADLESLRAVDPRSRLRLDQVEGSVLTDHLIGVGAAAAASAAAGDLDGRRVAIEGFGSQGPALARQVVEWGGRITAISTSAGTATASDGFDIAAVSSAWWADGDQMVAQFGDVEPTWKTFGAPCDVLFTGSKMGALSHQGAEFVKASVVVPSAPIPVTTKAFSMLRRAGVTVVPDFVATAGPVFAMWPDDDATAASVEADAVAAITDLMDELQSHADGPLLAGCYKAEAFLATWRDELPFGRPLAA